MSNNKYEEKTLEELMVEEPTISYSYADYLKWAFEDRVELIKGKIFKMSPGPNRRHQEVAFSLSNEIYNFLKDKKCKAYFAPFDVRLPKNRSDSDDKVLTVIQPDLCVVCNPELLDDKGCNGTPDLIVEILSPSTAKKDLTIKRELYQENGVSEYWIVYPNDEVIEVFILGNGKYDLPKTYVKTDEVAVHSLPGCVIKLKTVFDDG